MEPNIQDLIREKQRRESIPRLLQSCFDKQISFIQDPSLRKVLFIPRRSGKTWAVAVNLIIECLKNPATKCLYFGLTSESSWNAIYLHMIEVICRKYNITIDTNLTKQTITFENKSFIKITGADADEKQINKALGGKYKLVIFDECQDINHDLRYWIEDRLAPAMVDLGGVIVMAGTAGNHMGERYWYKVTRQDASREPGWNVHEWKIEDNPFMAKLIKSHLEKQIILNKDYVETSGYQQEWLCKWVTNTTSRIYKFDSSKNGIRDTELIKSLLNIDTKWKYILSTDYGYEDDTAMVVMAFYQHDPNCYIVDSFKKAKMLTQETAETLIQWRDKYKPVFIVGDAQNKTLIETLRIQYRIPIVAAKKLGKESHIAAMNSDFVMGKIKVIESHNRDLIKEWDELTWAEKQRLLGNYKENPGKDNHLADACLYGFFASKHYRATPEPPPIKPEDRFRLQAEKQLEEEIDSDNSIYGQLDRINQGY
jgi:hypothetical protein